MTLRGLKCILLVAALVWPISAFAYRPFDSTDADLADEGVWEVELAPFKLAPQ
jgi:hypothetical protein